MIMKRQIRGADHPMEIHVEGCRVQWRRRAIVPGLGMVGVEIGSLDDARIRKDKIDAASGSEDRLKGRCQLPIDTHVGSVDGGVREFLGYMRQMGFVTAENVDLPASAVSQGFGEIKTDSAGFEGVSIGRVYWIGGITYFPR